MKIHLHRWLWFAVAWLGCLPASADEFQVDGIFYDMAGDNKLMVTGSSFYLGDVVIPSSVTYGGSIYSVTGIRSEAFSGRTGLTSVTIPESVTSIGWGAFSGCTGLTSVTIPESVTGIGSQAFSGCSGLQSIVVAENNSSYASLEGVQFNKDKTTLIQCPGKKAGAYMIPSSVINIGEYTFQGCGGLTSITIPKSVTNIGDAAFSGCTGLTSVTIPESVTSIGWGAFSGCRGLTSVTIPESVTGIGSQAFSGCSGLTSVTIPEAVTSISWRTFSGCTGLTSVTIPESVTSIDSEAFEGCSGLTSVTIPESVTSIDSEAFEGCSGLTSVIWNARNCTNHTLASPFSNCANIITFTFGDNVEQIPAYLCRDMDKLTSITIPEAATSIGQYAFSGCTSLTSVTIPHSNASIKASTPSDSKNLIPGQLSSGVASIGNQAFYNCINLTSIDLPAGLTKIGDEAFKFCYLPSIALPGSVTKIGDGAFYCCNFTEIKIPDPVTAIGDETFYGCGKLAYVDIPEGVTSIGKSAFEACAALSSITLPVSLSHIGENVFAGCTDLSEIISKNPIPPSAESSTFDEMHYTESTLRVPIVSFSRYKVAEVWSNFVDMQETNVTRYTVEAVSADESAGSVIGSGTYDEGKTITLAAIPTSGYYFVQWSDGNTENPRQVTVTGNMTFVAEFELAGSAIETLENGERLIYTVDNTLHVGNNGEMYRIYTSTGQLVYTGNDAAVSLENSGIYIVCIGERSQKVIVK